jgi:hypothetical protein
MALSMAICSALEFTAEPREWQRKTDLSVFQVRIFNALCVSAVKF